MRKRKKSLYDIAIEKKQKPKDEKIIIQEKESVLKIVVSVIGKIIRLLMFLVFSFGLTVGTTVLINRELREQLINIININL